MGLGFGVFGSEFGGRVLSQGFGFGFRILGSERTVVACVRQLFFERSMSTTKIKREI